MAKGRFTFPVAILICLLLRIITGNEWQDVINLLVCALTAYLLIEINTAFTLIRTRSTLHVSFYVFLSTACLFLHSFQYAVFAPLTFLIAISQLFSSYESPYPAGSIFHAFFFIGLGSLLFPQLLYFVPLFYLGMISFRSLSLKSFFAGLTGLCVPYWLFFGYAFYYDKMNLFYHPLQEPIHFQPISYGILGMDRIISCGIITLISLVSSVHYFHVSYLDKVRTRIFLFFLIAVEAWIYLLGILQPQHFDILLQMQVIVGSILTGHLFTLTHNRFTGIFFIITFVLLIVLTIYNLWMQFLIDWGYWGLFLGSFIAGSVLPFSSEAVLAACVGPLGLDPVISITAATAGNVAGGMTCYWMGHLGNMEWIEKYFHVKKEKMDRAERFVHGRGAWMAFFAFIPILGSAISIVLGMMRANIWIVILAMTIGKILRYALLVWGILEASALMH